MNTRKLTLIFATIFIVGSFASAQENFPLAAHNNIIKDPEIPPIFVGGTGEMNSFIVNTLRYPQQAIDEDLQGLVVYTFVVEKDGTLSSFDIIHRTHPVLDAEALRILEAMPPWRPARNNGQTVRSSSFVPMYFRYNPNAGAGGAGRTLAYDMTKRNADVLNQPIYTIVDRMPEFASGAASMADFIGRVLRYPRTALQEGIEGRVLTSFIVGCNGAISNIEVVSPELPELHEEAIRLVSVMPRWTPGVRAGQAVNVRVLLPVDFVIDEEPILAP
jgi:TonB family protein